MRVEAYIESNNDVRAGISTSTSTRMRDRRVQDPSDGKTKEPTTVHDVSRYRRLDT
jgi:hypothetical protein